MVLDIPLTGLITQILAFPFEFSIGIIFLLSSYFILKKRIDYRNKMIEIREAPVGVNNLLRDRIKREILLTLTQHKKYVSKIGREVGYDPARARHHIKVLESFGLVKTIKLTREAYYTLTEKGMWCIKAIKKYYPKTVFAWIASRVSIPLEKHEDENWFKMESVPIKTQSVNQASVKEITEVSNTQ